MPRQTEPNANNALGNMLQGMLPGRQVWSENTQAVVGHAGLRPDIVVTAPGRSPVVVEAEYVPARTVEPEARPTCTQSRCLCLPSDPRLSDEDAVALDQIVKVAYGNMRSSPERAGN